VDDAAAHDVLVFVEDGVEGRAPRFHD